MAKANTELKPSKTLERETLKEESFETLTLEDICVTDDSDADPTFDLVEESRSRISKLSLKKSRPRKAKEVDSESEDEEESFGIEIPELNEKDGKCFEKVEELIRDGHVEKLKVEQCKVYLRKFGLRLTGNKSILIERIKEHLEIINGGGEKKYPICSFVLNCKGDACTGDVVMFEQNVYEMFSIASRSATGPPCGTRIVAGRIVKESYGAAKQQHTFTIEVLWSKGEKPLPPLHPLLIKGRNLYRLKTMRQRWADEEERRNVLQEKHSRGFVARSSRDTRIKGKEMRKMGIMQRLESKVGQHPSNSMQTEVVQQQKTRQIQHHEKENGDLLQQDNIYKLPVIPVRTEVVQQQDMHSLNKQQNMQQHHHQQLGHLQNPHFLKPQENFYSSKLHHTSAPFQKPYQYDAKVFAHRDHGFQSPQRATHFFQGNRHQYRNHFNDNRDRYQQHHRQPVSSSNHHMCGPEGQQHRAQPRQWCRYYHEGRCHYGENCKFLHE